MRTITKINIKIKIKMIKINGNRNRNMPQSKKVIKFQNNRKIR